MPTQQAQFPDALGVIGNTPLVQLKKIVPAGSARVLVNWSTSTRPARTRIAWLTP